VAVQCWETAIGVLLVWHLDEQSRALSRPSRTLHCDCRRHETAGISGRVPSMRLWQPFAGSIPGHIHGLHLFVWFTRQTEWRWDFWKQTLFRPSGLHREDDMFLRGHSSAQLNLSNVSLRLLFFIKASPATGVAQGRKRGRIDDL
jgi:hypothetical protein